MSSAKYKFQDDKTVSKICFYNHSFLRYRYKCLSIKHCHFHLCEYASKWLHKIDEFSSRPPIFLLIVRDANRQLNFHNAAINTNPCLVLIVISISLMYLLVLQIELYSLELIVILKFNVKWWYIYKVY